MCAPTADSLGKSRVAIDRTAEALDSLNEANCERVRIDEERWLRGVGGLHRYSTFTRTPLVVDLTRAPRRIGVSGEIGLGGHPM